MTSNLCQRINLSELKKHHYIICNNAVYSGRVAYFKSPEMRGRVTIFPSGKLISVGTQSESEAIFELESTKKFLVSKNVINDIELYFKIQNIVAVASFDKILNFEKIIHDYDITYMPEQFPGGILKMLEPYNVTVLLFASGKTVITGLKSEKQIGLVTKKLMDLINSCT